MAVKKKKLSTRGSPKGKANAKKRLAQSKKRTKKNPHKKEVMSSTPAQKIKRVAKNVKVGKLLKQTFSGFISSSVKQLAQENVDALKAKKKQKKTAKQKKPKGKK